ncbi:hypothetical protein EV360DRAFT_22777, partial [Lentinula raphanica]
MPAANPVWARALDVHSSYNVSQRSPDHVNSGYYLPPPRLIDGPSSPKSRAFYFRSWLKVRPLILKSLDESSKKVLISAKHWRSLLDVAGG